MTNNKSNTRIEYDLERLTGQKTEEKNVRIFPGQIEVVDIDYYHSLMSSLEVESLDHHEGLQKIWSTETIADTQYDIQISGNTLIKPFLDKYSKNYHIYKSGL